MAGTQLGTASNFPGGFAYGLQVRGMPLLQMQPGQVFFVGNGMILNPNQKSGSDSNRGTFNDPFATLNYAVNTACLQGRGDIVFILPGHAETISNATSIALACAGVAVIGLGAGSQRPTFTLDTATTANITVRSDSMSIQNCVFLNNFANIASVFTTLSASVTAAVVAGTAPSTVAGVGGLMTVTVVGSGTVYPGASVMGTGVPRGTIILSQVSGTTGGVGVYQLNKSFTFASGTITTGSKDFAIDSSEFNDLSSVLNALTVFTSSAIANGNDGFSFTNNRVSSLGTTAATTAIKFGIANDRIVISNNYGNSAVLNDVAAVLAAGAVQLTNLFIMANRWTRPNTSSTGGSFVSGSGNAWTGMAADNYFYQVDATAGIWIATGHGTAFGYQNNYSPITGAADASGLINPAAA